MNRLYPLFGGLTYAVVLSAPAYSADITERMAPSACAVSGPNGKLEAGALFIDVQNNFQNGFSDGDRYFGAGSITMPLGCDYGFQLDGAIGSLSGFDTWSAAGHLFARDPESHLVGLYGEFTEIGTNGISRFALEGERYLDDVTWSGIVGVEDSDVFGSQFLGAAQLSWYATDNFLLSIGVAHFLDITTATAGVEWQPDSSNVSFFAGGGAGEKDHATAYAGVRIYFGDVQKSLKRRHREDDPINWTQKLQRLGNDDLCPPGQIYSVGEGGPFCFVPGDID